MATIYIVEDDINIREIERYALKNSGYEVEEFEGSASFFKRLEKNIPSLILLDIMLPGEELGNAAVYPGMGAFNVK